MTCLKCVALIKSPFLSVDTQHILGSSTLPDNKGLWGREVMAYSSKEVRVVCPPHNRGRWGRIPRDDPLLPFGCNLSDRIVEAREVDPIKTTQ